MKRLYTYLLFAASILSACDQIDEANRLIHEPLPLTSRAVLVEDFTGQRCINCPTGAAEIQRLKDQYGADTVISVAIHAGPMAVNSTARVLGLRTSTGDEYAERFGIGDVMPAAHVNRQAISTNINEWGTLVRQAVQQPSPAVLAARVDYPADGRTIDIEVKVSALQDLDAYLQVWYTESGIIAQQQMPDGTVNRDYVHNHVFRAAVNGTWGEPFQLAEAEDRSFHYTFEPEDSWQTDNGAIVAFVYDANGVQQVLELNLNQQHLNQ